MEDACGRTTAAVTSCWGRFGVAVLWRRLRRMTWPRRRYRTYVLGAGGLNYDPLSYSQNFDDGKVRSATPRARLPGQVRPRAACRLAGAGGGTIESFAPGGASLWHEEPWGQGAAEEPRSRLPCIRADFRRRRGCEMK